MAVNGARMARGVRHLRVGQGVVGGAVIIGTGTGLGQAIVFLASPVLARIYSPTAFGIFGVELAIASTIIVVASLRFEAAIPLPRDDEAAFLLLALSLGMAGVVALACVPIVALFGARIAGWLRTPGLAEWLWFLPLMIFAGAVYQAMTYWGIRQASFGPIGRAKLAQGSAGVATQAAVGMATVASPFGLLLGDLASDAAGGLCLGRSALRDTGRFAAAVTPRRLWQAACAFRRFPLFASPASLFNVAALMLPVPLFAALYGSETAGAMVLTQRVVGAPIVLVSGAVGQSFLSRAARLAHEDPVAFGYLYNQAFVGLSVAGVVVCLGGVFVAPPLLLAFFGEEWREAATFAPYVAVASAAGLVVSPLSQVVYIGHRQGLQLVGDIARLVLVTGSVLVASVISSENATAGIAAYCASMIVVYAGWLVFYQRTCVRIVAAGEAR